jgi:hypothetical protein
LYNDPVKVISEKNEFSFVELLTQPNLYSSSWTGYRGYMLTSQLTPLTGALLNLNVSVVRPYATVFKRACIQNGCLTEDVEAKVSFGTWFSLLSEEDGWGKVKLPSGAFGYLRMADLTYFSQSESEIRQQMVERSAQLLG